jgi:hypothetical protein
MDKERMNDQQIEHLIQSSLFSEAAQASPKSGTFFAIQDRLGEQNGPGMRHRISDLSDQISEAIWRIIPVPKQRMAQTIALVAIVVVVGVYLAFAGSDDNENGVAAVPSATSTPALTATALPPTPTPETVVKAGATSESEKQNSPENTPTANSTAQPLPTPTEVPPTPTAEPTATRVPLPTAAPTATPVPLSETSVDLSGFELPITQDGLFELPENLRSTADPISTDEVIEQWTSLLSDTRIILSGTIFGDLSSDGSRPTMFEFGDRDHIFCGGGRGFYIGVPATTPDKFIGQIFTWEVKHSAAAAWHSPRLLLINDNESVYIQINTGANPQPGSDISLVMDVKNPSIDSGGSDVTFYSPGAIGDLCSTITQ